MPFEPLPNAPVEDEQSDNPFYDPRYSAAQYIEMTVSAIQAEQQVKLEDIEDGTPYDAPSYRHKIHAAALDNPYLLADSSIEIESSPPKYTKLLSSTLADQCLTSPQEIKTDITTGLNTDSPGRAPQKSTLEHKLRRSESTSDVSFELSRQASQINYNRYSSSASPRLSSDDDSGHESQPQIRTPYLDTPLQSEKYLLSFYQGLARQLEDEIYGPSYGSVSAESVRALARDVDKLMPGIRLERNIETMCARNGTKPTFQIVLDYLGQHGLLSPATLNLFRGLDGVKALDLRETLKNCSLLLPPEFRVDLLQVLDRPHSFPYLTQLNLNGIFLDDEDIRWICRLPALSVLFLAATRIRDESIAYLVPLKSTLCSLTIAHNTRLTDDCCSSLSHLTSLSVLDIFKTSITIAGMRRFVRDLPSTVTVEVNLTDKCFEYLSDISSTFPYPSPDYHDNHTIHGKIDNLIDNPTLVHGLNEPQLQANILAYTSRSRLSPSRGSTDTSIQYEITPGSLQLKNNTRLLESHFIPDAVASLFNGSTKAGVADTGGDSEVNKDIRGTPGRHILARVLEKILMERRADEKVLEVLGWLGAQDEDVEDADVGMAD